MGSRRNRNNRNKRKRTKERLNRKENWAARLAQKDWMQRAVARVAADEWWEKLSFRQKVLAMTITGMMGEMSETKRIEIRLEAGAVRARFIHLLHRPERGCLSAIVLPEAPAEPWN